MTACNILRAALAALALATAAAAQEPALTLTEPVAPIEATRAEGAAATAPAPVARIVKLPKKPWLVFAVRGGVDTAPAYFGSADTLVWHDWHVTLNYLRLGRHRIMGSPDPQNAERYGFSLRHDFRLINGRDPYMHPELSGTYLLPPSLELGVGMSYSQRKYRVYADARYGLFGHKSWSGEVGGDYRMYPSDSLELWIGPRFTFGTDSYADKWYGIDALENFYSGLPIFDPSPGLLRVGIEFGGTLDIGNKWEVEAAFTYDRLVNSAAASPITQMGSAEQLAGRIGLVRYFTWR